MLVYVYTYPLRFCMMAMVIVVVRETEYEVFVVYTKLYRLRRFHNLFTKFFFPISFSISILITQKTCKYNFFSRLSRSRS